MKREKLETNLQAAVLSWLLAYGAVGALATGMRLNAQRFGAMAVLWAVVCLLTVLLSQVRFGGWVLLAAGCLSALRLLHNEQAFTQTLELLCRITKCYHNAYGWSYLRAPQMGSGPADAPLAVLGAWIALVNCRQLVREKAGLAPVLLSALPLMVCVVVTDTVPESKFLYAWLLGMILVLLSGGVRKEQNRWAVNVVHLAAIPTALALGLLFWAVPRAGYDKQPDELQARVLQWFRELPDQWEQIGGELAEKVDGTIQPDTIDLQNTGPRIRRVYPVMEVTAPVSGTVYLRGHHYDTYTGTGWTVTPGIVRFTCPEETREMGSITVTTRAVRDVIYLPYYPDEAWDLAAGCIGNSSRTKTNSYIMRSLYTHWRDVVETRAARMDEPLLHVVNPQYLALPEDTEAWAAQLVDTILHEETTATAVADAIADYVRGSARYDLNTPKMNWESGDFARWFLEDSNTGYCVHFATAATVLLRAAGVEARYVEGYMFTAVMGEETTVTADQAHAWAEYYEPLLDTWIVLEATPSDSTARPQTQPTAAESETTQPVQTTGNEKTEPEVTRPKATGGADTPDKTEQEKENSLPEGIGKLLRWLLRLSLGLGAIRGQRLLRLRLRERRRRKGGSNERALFAWRELEQLYRLLKCSPPEEARSVALKAKYSPHTISRQELALLADARSDALAHLEAARWHLRLIGKYIFSLF